jgi:hypothetical protein
LTHRRFLATIALSNFSRQQERRQCNSGLFGPDRRCGSRLEGISLRASGGAADPAYRIPRSVSDARAIAAASGIHRPSPRAVLDRYCVTCHNQRVKTGGLTLDNIDVTDVGAHPELPCMSPS